MDTAKLGHLRPRSGGECARFDVHNSDIYGKLRHMVRAERVEPDEVLDTETGPIGHCPVCDAYFSVVPGGHFDMPVSHHCAPELEE